MTYDDWTRRYPEAARALASTFAELVPTQARGKLAEAWSLQEVRLKVAKSGAFAFRNNVGVTQSRCDTCGTQQRPVRYGLANDTKGLNTKFKSSDLILAIPRVIVPAMVGKTIAQFGGIEVKRPGWRYTGTPPEKAQAAWLTFVKQLGGYATFSTGDYTP